MNIGILGSGMVGRTLSVRLVQLGHAVMVGTRDVERTLARAEPDVMGNPPFRVWHQQNPQVKLGTFAEAAAFGEIVFNCTTGSGSLNALKMAGERNLNAKVLIDIANPLDFSCGMPPALSACNTDSLGEQIQRAFPQAKVVKTLNTINADLMVNPALLSDDHDVFVSGNDPATKAQVIDILKNWFGWNSVIDLGDITTARGAEMLLPLSLNLLGALQTPIYNFKVVH
jgi:predicted dinucleotide-binding enzyme